MHTHPGAPTRTRRRRGRRAVVLLATTAVTATACSSSHKSAATTVPPRSTTTAAPSTSTTAPAVLPLTGLPASSPAQLQNPAVVVKVDNVDAARPQTGIDQADIVYEVLVEGGLTRLAAIFQSKYPNQLGPVRSGRLTDEGVADDLNHPVLVYAGANAMFQPILQSQPLTDVTMSSNPDLFQRIGNNAPHNLFLNVNQAAALSKTHTAPAPLFHYLASGQSFGGAGVAPASAVSVSFPAASAAWTYNPQTGVYYRTQNGTPDKLSDGAQVTASNVVVEFVNYVSSGMATGEGLPPTEIPNGIQTGSGQAWFFTGGKVVKGNWTRPNLTTPAAFTDSAGAPIAIQPGVTWIELAPNGTIPAITP